MLWFKNRSLKEIDKRLADSFTNLKQDTSNIFAWITYFKQKIDSHESLINNLQTQLSASPKTKEDIRAVIDYYYSYQSLIDKVQDIDKRLFHITQQPNSNQHVLDEINTLKNRLEKLESHPNMKKSNIREKMIKKITQKSKEYVKNLILSHIHKYEKISALKLREMIVEEQGLCSKTSFYRLLDELSNLDEIDIVQEGKEKYIFSKIMHQT